GGCAFVVVFCLFFFQAEDGIRDFHVTGVQTCALPICYVETLRELRHGIVYCDDLYQGPKLPTQWAMTSSIVNALGRMVPAPVDHLYCDNAVLALGKRTNCIRYLSDVVIEHMHYVVGKAQKDSTYARVNSNQQYRVDSRAYRRWAGSRDGLALDVRRVQKLRGGN